MANVEFIGEDVMGQFGSRGALRKVVPVVGRLKGCGDKEKNSHLIGVFHYLIWKSEGNFVSHCLDMDMIATARNEAESIRRLNCMVKSAIESAIKDADLGVLDNPASEKYWRKYVDGPVESGGEIVCNLPKGFLSSSTGYAALLIARR